MHFLYRDVLAVCHKVKEFHLTDMYSLCREGRRLKTRLRKISLSFSPSLLLSFFLSSVCLLQRRAKDLINPSVIIICNTDFFVMLFCRVYVHPTTLKQWFMWSWRSPSSRLFFLSQAGIFPLFLRKPSFFSLSFDKKKVAEERMNE